MNEPFSIVPPPELVEEWKRTAPHPINEREHYHYVTLCAAQWGSDQELNYCCDELSFWGRKGMAERLRSDRRPKPPSLKEQALLQLDTLNADLAMHGRGCDLSQIRRALEALPND
jgi:hypothetical protein